VLAKVWQTVYGAVDVRSMGESNARHELPATATADSGPAASTSNADAVSQLVGRIR